MSLSLRKTNDCGVFVTSNTERNVTQKSCQEINETTAGYIDTTYINTCKSAMREHRERVKRRDKTAHLQLDGDNYGLTSTGFSRHLPISACKQ